MKDLLNKERYCYKSHTLLIKSSAHPLFNHIKTSIERKEAFIRTDAKI